VSYKLKTMNNKDNQNAPIILEKILSETQTLGFQMVSEPLTGSFLKTLVASKLAGCFLELGTGTGVSTAWILSGMDSKSQLISVENNSSLASIAQRYLGHDPRVTFHVEDAEILIERLKESRRQFDLIFADTWVGKYTHLEDTLDLLKPGGLYVIDDMLPQANWPDGHGAKAVSLIAILESRKDLTITKLNWASGIIIAAKLQ
jgi:predicted O-methyltransferase YrrM